MHCVALLLSCKGKDINILLLFGGSASTLLVVSPFEKCSLSTQLLGTAEGCKVFLCCKAKRDSQKVGSVMCKYMPSRTVVVVDAGCAEQVRIPLLMIVCTWGKAVCPA